MMQARATSQNRQAAPECTGAGYRAAKPHSAEPFDTRAYRDALASFPTGVAIVTTLAGGVAVGLTCNSFSPVSLEPPLVLWSLRRESSSMHAFSNAPAFAINVLTKQGSDLSARFASKAIADKFAGVEHSAGYRGVPLLAHCTARFECSAFAQHEAGDHVIFIGRVERFDVGSGDDSLVFYRGAYRHLAPPLRLVSAQTGA
jgi:flavin reductase (DIM6/NTAB) family NADH-FMN oxidoreductase RutF